MGQKTDFREIRGFNYSTAYRTPQEQLVREMGYAKRLNLNSVRIWLEYKEYQEDPGKFMDNLHRFVDTVNGFGITVMPILFNGNLLDLTLLDQETWGAQDAYVRDVIRNFAGNPGIIMWDIMNEPRCNDYALFQCPDDEKDTRWAQMVEFVGHHSDMIRQQFPDEILTIGHMVIQDCPDTADMVDVITFHDYSPTNATMEEAYQEARRLSEITQKPVMNTELCCLCRANPYDLALQKCQEHQMGWYLFELMIDGYWGDIHGIFYADGTVRDPSIPAAVLGFYRNRSEQRVMPNLNKEGHADLAIAAVQKALQNNIEAFRFRRNEIEVILEAAEYCANLLEACEMVPMYDPPTAQIERIRKSGDGKAARELAYQLALKLREVSQIL